MRNRTLFGTVVSAMLTTMASCVSAPQHNTLTKAEIADGWQLFKQMVTEVTFQVIS